MLIRGDKLMEGEFLPVFLAENRMVRLLYQKAEEFQGLSVPKWYSTSFADGMKANDMLPYYP